MTKLGTILVGTLFLSASAWAECDQTSGEKVLAEGGGSDIFMDKRSPEERCETSDNFAHSGGDPKVFKDDDANETSEFMQSGGDTKIFMDPRAPDDRGDLTDGFMESGGDPKIFKDDGTGTTGEVKAEGGGSGI